MLSPLGYYRPGSVYPRALLRRPPPDTQILGAKNVGVLDGAGALGGGSSGHALIICTSQQPEHNAGSQYLNVWVYNYSTGDVYYLYPCCRSTTTTGTLEVKFTCTSAPSYWNAKVGDIDQNFLVVPNTLGGVFLGVCVDGDARMVKVEMGPNPNEPGWDDNLSAGNGRYSGLGHNNAGHVNYFDDYNVGEMLDADGKVCNNCFCRCLGRAIPRTLSATIVNTTGTAGCAEGETGLLEWEWNSGQERWKGDIVVVDGSDSHTFSWCLSCDSLNAEDPANPGANFALSLCGPDGCSSAWPSGYLTVFRPTDASTCYPLKLRFGPMVLPTIDTMCFMCPSLLPGAGGEFYVDVTL
jgi:hypothetical protein